MEIRTFTGFWSLERKLYSIYDFSLPFPVSLRVLGVFFGTGIPWWLVMYTFQVSFDPPWYLLWILPPGILAWFGSKPIFEGKTLFQYLRSRIQYLFENQNYKGLHPDLNKYEENIEFRSAIITRKPLKALPF